MPRKGIKANLERRGIKAQPLEASEMRVCSPEESKALSESCPTFRIRVTGIERDGSPFDCIKTVRAPYAETAKGMLEVQAMICHGCRVDSCEVVEQIGDEWPAR